MTREGRENLLAAAIVFSVATAASCRALICLSCSSFSFWRSSGDRLLTKEEIEEYVMKNFSDVFSGFDIVKKVIVPGRIVNIVVKPKQ